MSSTRDSEGKTEAKNPRLFDVRTVERNIKKGLITRKDYEKHLKSLADTADKLSRPGDNPTDDDDDSDILDDADEGDDEGAAAAR